MSKIFDPNAAAAADAGLFGLGTLLEEAGVVVIGVPFDATASYRKGAARGPDAVLRASRQVDLFDLATGRPYEAGIAMEPVDERIVGWNSEATELADPIIAAGGNVAGDKTLERGLARVNAIGGELNRLVHEKTRAVLARERLPAIVGGDHSVPFGAIQACAEHYGEIGVLHFDAHADLRPAYEGFEWSHASIMHNVASKLSRVTRLVQVGVRDFSEQEYEQIHASNGAIRVVFDRDWAAALLDGEDPRKIIREHLALLPKYVYVSFDIDGLDPALCPNTGTPVPGGLSWREANLWLDELAKSERRVVGVDLNEVNPGNAGPDEDAWDAIIGARMLYRLIGTALATRGRT